MAKEYDPNRDSVLIEQYKIYVELTDRVSSRRVDASKFYVSVLTALLVVIPFAVDQNTPTNLRRPMFLILGLLGLALCLLWMLNIRSYSQLNRLKFSIITQMEKQLPFPCYQKEWQLLGQEGKNSPKYVRLSKVEAFVPMFLAIPFFVLIVMSIFA